MGGCKHCDECNHEKKCQKQLARFNKFYSSPVPNPEDPDPKLAKTSIFQADTSLELKSFADLTNIGFPCLQTSKYDSWCFDKLQDIKYGSIDYSLISLLDKNAKEIFQSWPGIETPRYTTYFEGLNYLLNQVERYLIFGSVSNIQNAIWKLLFDEFPSSDIEEIQAIITEVINVQNKWNLDQNDCLYLIPNGIVGLLVFPSKTEVKGGLKSWQALCISMTLREFDRTCNRKCPKKCDC